MDPSVRGARCPRVPSESGQLAGHPSGLRAQVRRLGRPVDLTADDLWPAQGGLPSRQLGSLRSVVRQRAAKRQSKNLLV